MSKTSEVTNFTKLFFFNATSHLLFMKKKHFLMKKNIKHFDNKFATRFSRGDEGMILEKFE